MSNMLSLISSRNLPGKNHIAATMAVAVFALVGCASSPEPDPAQRRGGAPGAVTNFSGIAAAPLGILFTSFDANSDRLIDGDELRTGIDEEWTAIEAVNGTTPLGYKVWQRDALGSENAFPAFLSFDRNLDNEMTKTEFDEAIRQEFASLDANKDGQLQRSELLINSRRPQRGQQGGPQGGRGRQGGQGGRGGGGRGGPPGGGRRR